MLSDETPCLADLTPDPARWWGIGEVVHLAVPTVLNTVSITVMQFVDGWMVSTVSKEALSAQFIGGISAFVPVCFFMGLLSCVSTFASQNLGAGRPERSSVYGWHGLWVAWAAAALLALLIVPAPHLMALFGHEPHVAALETTYFQILLGGSFFALSARALGAWFVGIHRPGINLVAGVIANVVNVVANWVLIFGKFGFPELGLAGAGIGTVLGFAVEAAVFAVVFVSGVVGRRFQVRRQFGFRWSAVKDLVRIGAPAGAVFSGDILMWTIFMGRVLGGFGTAHLAAAAVLNRYWHLCFMPAIGVSSAVTAIVGRYCGAGRTHLAWRRAHAGFALAEVYMVSTGLVLWVARGPLVAIFNEAGDPLVQSIAERAMLVILVCQVFDAMNVIFIGSLRGAGDTLWPGIVQLALCYGLGLGGSWLVATLKPAWGSFGPWGAVTVYIAVLGLVMWGRFLGGKWRTMQVVQPPHAVPVTDEPTSLPPG
jgi:MATE family multidrug resistance protein